LTLVAVGFWGYTRFVVHDIPVTVFKILEDQGYTPNTGFSGAFSPGNVVQIKESGSNGQVRTLNTPVVFLWKSVCFPEVALRVDPFVLPQVHGTSTASLSIRAGALSKLLPSLKFDSDAAIDYTLKIESPHVYTLAKGDLSGRFSETCVQAYDRQLRAGDKPEWFAVILDAIVAEDLAFEIQWKAGTSAESRASATKQAVGALAQVLQKARAEKQAAALPVSLRTEEEEQTVIAAKGSVIVGYRARPLQRE
jgi:hypothetical protein